MSYNRFLFLAFLISVINADNSIIQIPQGLLRGTIDIDRHGKEFYKFMNIPYAKPPIDNLRFKAPVPDDGWDGVREGDETIPMCFQYSITSDVISGSEDCLYLNVYIPELPNENSTLKPVMFFLPGGRFIRGSPRLGGKYLMSKDIILVTVAYRVGIFGFFNLNDGDLDVPGNAGLKDQAMALRWVYDNIEHFGGDKDNVVVAGQSAGASSVHLHVLSPMVSGLFSKAICESGVALIDLVGGVRNNGILLAENLNIQTDNLKEMLTALRELPAWNISKTEKSLANVHARFSGPLVEIPSKEESFLLEEPIDIIQNGNYNQVPLIIGYNSAEGLMFQMEAKELTGKNLTITDFTRFIPPDLEIQKGSEEETILSARFKKFYYGDSEPSEKDITIAVNLYTDYTFGYPSYRSAVEHSKTIINPLYFYYFSADTELNLRKKAEEVSANFPGASHSDECYYIFDEYGTTTPEIIEGSVEDLGIERMTTMWSNFAHYGNPTPPGSELIWLSLQNGTFNYLHIDTEESTMKTVLFPEVMAFWNQIYYDFFPRIK